MFSLLDKYKVNIFNIPFLKKIKDRIWYLAITSPYQRKLEGKEKILEEIEKMRKEKMSLWKKRRKLKKMILK